ncbi:hypothetical protein JEQ12_009107 [Ovis aries]|uniref:Uncharacterized protein n=1 Tax=Ovis aries TaxID=9940 RepID=A0A836D537_SHEEP|nr:hypothetical protein JEQ12_009107 [Ovis aries]
MTNQTQNVVGEFTTGCLGVPEIHKPEEFQEPTQLTFQRDFILPRVEKFIHARFDRPENLLLARISDSLTLSRASDLFNAAFTLFVKLLDNLFFNLHAEENYLKNYTIIETDEEESRHCALIQVATVDNEV